MDHARKRKLSDGTVASSSRVTQGPSEFRTDFQQSGQMHVDSTFDGDRRRGHDYSDISMSGESRIQLGDSFVTNNYSAGPSREEREEERYKEFMQSLGFERMDFRRQTIEQAHAETCQWVFQTEQYLRWQDPAWRESHHGFFWIKGKPGSGKSTIMKCMLEHLQHRTPSCTILSFFFNARGEQLERTIQGCYRSLLYQILERIPQARGSVPIPAFFTKEQEWQVVTIRDMLRQAIRSLLQMPLILIIDALDECKDDEVRDMINFIDGLAQSAKQLQICFASRHYPQISVRHCEELVLDSSDAHERDIRQYIRDQLSVGFQADSFEDQLIHEIRKKAQGVFMWVVLVVRIANERFDQGFTQPQLLASVRALPDALNALLSDIISAGSSDAHLLPTLLWVLIGNRNMSLLELYVGIKTGAGDMTSALADHCPVDRATMVRFIVHSSKGLVEAADYSYGCNIYRFEFIHESVREHILAGKLAGVDPRLSRNVEANGHAQVVDWCFKYIQEGLPAKYDLPKDQLSGKVAWEMLDEIDDYDRTRHDQMNAALPLTRYVHDELFSHLNKAYNGKAFALTSLQSFPLREYIYTYNICENEAAAYVSSTVLLHLLLDFQGYTSHPEIIGYLLAQYAARPDLTPHARQTYQQTCSKSILAQNLNSSYGGFGVTPLIAAVSAGWIEYVELLLDLGADVNMRSERDIVGWDETPLIAAVEMHKGNCLPLVKLLVDRGANVNAWGDFYGSALATAARFEEMEVVELLLEHGADAGLEDSEGRNLILKHLTYDLHRRSDRVMQLFRNLGLATSEACGKTLLIAAQGCNERFIEMSVGEGADVNSRDFFGRTGVHIISEGLNLRLWISESDRLKAAAALLRLGADVNAAGGDYHMPLIAASANGFQKLVRLFLDHGADQNHRSEKYGTAIEAAEKADHKKVVEILTEARRHRHLAQTERDAAGYHSWFARATFPYQLPNTRSFSKNDIGEPT